MKEALVVDRELLIKVFEKFLNKLKQKEIIDDFLSIPSENIIRVEFNQNTDIPEGPENLISKGIFSNLEKILEDLGYDVENKTVVFPLFSTAMKSDFVVEINY